MDSERLDNRYQKTGGIYSGVLIGQKGNCSLQHYGIFKGNQASEFSQHIEMMSVWGDRNAKYPHWTNKHYTCASNYQTVRLWEICQSFINLNKILMR
jgi:hypothetical protein